MAYLSLLARGLFSTVQKIYLEKLLLYLLGVFACTDQIIYLQLAIAKVVFLVNDCLGVLTYRDKGYCLLIELIFQVCCNLAMEFWAAISVYFRLFYYFLALGDELTVVISSCPRSASVLVSQCGSSISMIALLFIMFSFSCCSRCAYLKSTIDLMPYRMPSVTLVSRSSFSLSVGDKSNLYFGLDLARQVERLPPKAL